MCHVQMETQLWNEEGHIYYTEGQILQLNCISVTLSTFHFPFFYLYPLFIFHRMLFSCSFSLSSDTS